MSIVRDTSLAGVGEKRIQWAKSYMPLLSALETEYANTQPLRGYKLAVSVHLEAKTAYLCRVLQAAGASMAVTGSNPLSTRDDIAAALAASGMEVYAWYNATPEEYFDHLKKTLSIGPQLLIDDGGDFLQLLHGELSSMQGNVIGGCEETTTGVMRMRARAAKGSLAFPMIAINDAKCKHFFDNRFGCGQSVWDGFMRATNLLISGKTVVVAGFGYCSRGVAERARGLGARVIITEVDPVKALEAAMDGYSVMKMIDAAPLGDIFLTLTGSRDVIARDHMQRMKNGAILANAGHFDVEINKKDLSDLAASVELRRKDIKGFVMPDGRIINLLADGRLLNLAAGDGHPVEIMDMSFALQALCLVELAQSSKRAPGVYDVPAHIDEQVAKRKLAAMGVSIDSLSGAQTDYLAGTND